MKYWDSSAVVSLLVDGGHSAGRISLLEQDPSILSWWGSQVECASALNRLHREGVLDALELDERLVKLRSFAATWTELAPRARALRLLRVHPLRGADAMQLAAALVASKEDPSTLDFVCSDARLSQAASREGFSVV